MRKFTECLSLSSSVLIVIASFFVSICHNFYVTYLFLVLLVKISAFFLCLIPPYTKYTPVLSVPVLVFKSWTLVYG